MSRRPRRNHTAAFKVAFSQAELEDSSVSLERLANQDDHSLDDIFLAGTPATTLYCSTSLVTTAPAPITDPLPK